LQATRIKSPRDCGKYIGDKQREATHERPEEHPVKAALCKKFLKPAGVTKELQNGNRDERGGDRGA
jgi:hypothetical protein